MKVGDVLIPQHARATLYHSSRQAPNTPSYGKRTDPHQAVPLDTGAREYGSSTGTTFTGAKGEKAPLARCPDQILIEGAQEQATTAGVEFVTRRADPNTPSYGKHSDPHQDVPLAHGPSEPMFSQNVSGFVTACPTSRWRCVCACVRAFVRVL